ncbi:MAG: hypothetical protein QW035_03910 [Candidatus Anstonellales archaeon]
MAAPKNKDLLATYGPWFFVLAVLVAIVAGLLSLDPVLATLLMVVLGLLVGITNITSEEEMLFLVASLAFIAGAGSLGPLFATLNTVFAFGTILANILNYFVAFAAPAAFVVALKALYRMSKD